MSNNNVRMNFYRPKVHKWLITALLLWLHKAPNLKRIVALLHDVRPSVRLSVCPTGTGVYWDYIVHHAHNWTVKYFCCFVPYVQLNDGLHTLFCYTRNSPGDETPEHLWHRSILLPLLRLTIPTEGFSCYVTISVKFCVEVTGWLRYKMAKKYCRKLQPIE